MSKESREDFTTACGCLVALIALPTIAFICYFLIHVIIWLIPVILVGGIVLFVLYIFCRGLMSFCKD